MYPHLAAELHRLSGDALDLWGNAETRRRALTDILAAWDRGDAAALERAVRRVDAAVVAGLVALGLARHPWSSVQLDSFGRAWIGRVAADGTILFDVEWLRHHVMTAGRPDRLFRTWIHESLHARRPGAPGRLAEYARWPGYEEGLADGLARNAAACAGIIDGESPYDYYVAAYLALAGACGVGAEPIWRALWRLRPGEVRAGFATAVQEVRREGGLVPLRTAESSRLVAVGDTVFGERRHGDRPDPAVLARLWEAVFR